MKKNLKNFSTMCILTLSLGLLITGCTSTEQNPVDENIPSNEEGLTPNQPSDLEGDRNINKGNSTVSEPNAIDGQVLDESNNNNSDDNAMMERSKKLAMKISELDKVNSANVLITGNTALVGIDIPKDSNDEDTEKIKDTVENKAKELDKDVDNVVVTADADLITRIKDLGNDIESGKPISGLGQEIEEIIKRITPNM